MIPINLHICTDTNSIISCYKSFSEINNHGFIFPFWETKIVNYRLPVTVSIYNLQLGKDETGYTGLGNIHIDTGICGEQPALQEQKDRIGMVEIAKIQNQIVQFCNSLICSRC